MLNDSNYNETNNTMDYTSRQTRFERCRPQTSTECKIEAVIVRPQFQVEVRNYFWENDLGPTPFEIDICYLELALNRRPDGALVSYMRGANPDSFVSTGNCCFIPPHQRTTMRTSHGKQLVIGCLFEEHIFAPYIDWQWTPLELAACINIHNMHIHTALIQLSQEVLNPGYKSAQFVDALFQYILVELSRHIRAARRADKNFSGKLSPQQLQLIEMLVEQSSHSFPQTSWLAEQCGISTRHLARMFKKTTGLTVTEYVTENRIERAKTRLLRSNAMIKEIAYECGFQSPSAFAQAFKNATGLTPKQFRAPQ